MTKIRRRKLALEKIDHAYQRAEISLRMALAAEFPRGTKVRCTHTGFEAEVEGTSLYADCVMTTRGHMRWRYLEKMT